MHLMRQGRDIVHARRAARLVEASRQPASRLPASAAGGDEYLRLVGNRVRELRARRGMTRKILARDSQVSERYLAQLESGEGNISILLLRQIAQALDTPVESLAYAGAEPAVELVRATEFLRGLRPDELRRARDLLSQEFGSIDADTRHS